MLRYLAVLFLLFSIISNAHSLTIDFEKNKGWHSSIGDYYSAEGVVFGPSWSWYGQDSTFPPSSGDWTIVGNPRVTPFEAWIEFKVPVSNVSAYFNVYTYPLTWEAYNDSMLLGSLELTTKTQQPPIVMKLYSFSYDNITRLLLKGESLDSYNMDDLSFNPSPVPEPVSVILFGTGLSLLGFAIRKFKKV